MNLSYALGDDADLRHRLMVKIGAPLAALEPVTAAGVTTGNNHTPETPDSDPLQRITSDVYRAAQTSSATGESGGAL